MNNRIQQALDDLVEAIREETVASFSALLSGDRVGNGPARARSAPKARKGGKRTSEELAAFKSRVLATIRKKPRLRTEQIAAELGTTTKELQLPMLQLRDEKLIAMKGQKRAATYVAK